MRTKDPTDLVGTLETPGAEPAEAAKSQDNGLGGRFETMRLCVLKVDSAGHSIWSRAPQWNRIACRISRREGKEAPAQPSSAHR
jgi:hypothetical protein